MDSCCDVHWDFVITVVAISSVSLTWDKKKFSNVLSRSSVFIGIILYSMMPMQKLDVTNKLNLLLAGSRIEKSYLKFVVY